MKTFKIFLFLLILCSANFAYTINDSILAIVNNTSISSFDLENRIKLFIKLGNLKSTDLHSPEVRSTILQTMINEEIIRSEGNKKGVKLDTDVLNLEVNDISKKIGVSNDKNLKQSLFRLIEVKNLWNDLKGVFLPQVSLSEHEVKTTKDFLPIPEEPSLVEKVRYSELIVYTKGKSSEKELIDIVNTIYKELKKGTKFSALVQQFSETSSKEKAGDVGFVKISELSKEMLSMLSSLQMNQVSKPIILNERGDFMIVQLTGVKLKKQRNRKQLINQDQIKMMIYGKKQSIFEAEYMKKLRSAATVTILSK